VSLHEKATILEFEKGKALKLRGFHGFPTKKRAMNNFMAHFAFLANFHCLWVWWSSICKMGVVSRRQPTMKIFPSLAVFSLCAALWSTPARAQDSFVRVLHALTTGPKVDVFIDGDKKLNDVTFGSVTTYMRLPSGRHTIRIEGNNPSRVLINRSVSLRPGDFYTLAPYGTMKWRRLGAFNDSAGTVPAGRALVTFYHLAPGAQAFDARVTTEAGGTYIVARKVRYGIPRPAAVPAVPLSVRLLSRGRTLKTLTGNAPRAGRKYAFYAIGRPERNFRVMMDVVGSQ
jgi:hypothetical protein